ncbi:hypothetical protein V6N13_110853 [Hibiscus sabdariffa]
MESWKGDNRCRAGANNSWKNEPDNQRTTLFMENVPATFHWKGLWHTVGRLGNVVDAFIASKRSRSGKRFGFVRFARKSDANRVMVRL